MSSNKTSVYCEICEKPARYRPQLNRTFCLVHTQEYEAERAIRLYITKNTESVAAEMLKQYQFALSKQKILELMKDVGNKMLDELAVD